MAHTVLGSVSLGYQLVWNTLRQLRGVHLFIGTHERTPVDGRQLLSALQAQWSAQAPTLLLSVQSPQLLSDLLDHAPLDCPWLEVNNRYLRDPAIAQRVHQAHQRGLPLVWRGDPGTRPSAALAPCFARTMVTLSAEEALAGLRVSLRKHNGIDPARPSRVTSPVRAGHIYESVPSRVLIEHCLDEQDVWGVAGWPMEDVLHGYRHRRIQPDHQALMALINALDTGQSMDTIEQLLSQEPVLAYCFLRYANSAGLGLRTQIESIRQGLMVLGFSLLRTWLHEQLPHATNNINLAPVRSAMVLRARLMAQLLGSNHDAELRREVFMCGLMSQIDLLLGEPFCEALARFPFPQRIHLAIQEHTGPHVPLLDLATSLESANTQATRTLCEEQGRNLEEVNLALLHTLQTQAAP